MTELFTYLFSFLSDGRDRSEAVAKGPSGAEGGGHTRAQWRGRDKDETRARHTVAPNGQRWPTTRKVFSGCLPDKCKQFCSLLGKVYLCKEVSNKLYTSKSFNKYSRYFTKTWDEEKSVLQTLENTIKIII